MAHADLGALRRELRSWLQPLPSIDCNLATPGAGVAPGVVSARGAVQGLNPVFSCSNGACQRRRRGLNIRSMKRPLRRWVSRLLGGRKNPESPKAGSATSPELSHPASEDGSQTPAPISRSDVEKREPGVAGLAEEPADWEIGDTILGIYQVKYIHTGGGMGLVYRVRHLGWNLDLALKSPRKSFFRTEAHKHNFARECETWVGLGVHPHVASCLYVRTIDGVPRVFAEYVEGGSLREWIATGKLYDGGMEEALPRLLDIAIQMAWGLDYAHSRSVIHQDVKPANVLMLEEGTAKITDFGLARARAIAGEAAGPAACRSSLVSNGGMTPAYCSPEQAGKRLVTLKTDIWSWAVSVLEMFAGRVIWKSGVEVRGVLDRWPELLDRDEARLPIPRALAALLERCFSELPENRPSDCSVLAQEVRSIYSALSGQPYAREEPVPLALLADGFNNRGVSLWDLGKMEEADRAFSDALEDHPAHVQATFNHGLIKWSSGATTDAEFISALEDACEQRPRDWMPRYLLGIAHLERRDTAAALTVFEQARQKGGGTELLEAIERAKGMLANSIRVVRQLDGGWVGALALSTNGELLLSGHDDTVLRLWDVNSGALLREFKGHTEAIRSVTFSSGGQYALSGGADNTLRWWELKDGHCLRVLQGHTNWVNSAAISSDGRHGLSGSADGTLRLWDIGSGQCVSSLPAHEGWVRAVAWSGDGSFCVTGGADTRVKLWDLRRGQCMRILEGHTDQVNSVALSSDGRRAASGSKDTTLRIWDVETSRCALSLARKSGEVRCVVLSRDGRQAISCHAGGILSLWDADSGRCLRTFEQQAELPSVLAVSADDRRLASGGTNRILVWDLGLDGWKSVAKVLPLAVCKLAPASAARKTANEFGQLLRDAETAMMEGRFAECLNLVRDAQRLEGYRASRAASELAARAGRHGAKLAPRVLRQRRSLEGHTGGVCSSVLSRDGQWAFSGSLDRTVRVWETASGGCQHVLEGHEDAITAVAVDAHCRWIVSGSRDKTARLWEMSTGRCLCAFTGHERGVAAVAFSPDARWVATGSHDKTTRVWDRATGRCLRSFAGHLEAVISVAVSADGRTVLSSAGDATIRWWEVATGRCLQIIRTQSVQSSAALFTDGRRALSGGNDGSVRSWDLATARLLGTFDAREGEVVSLALSADGCWALSGHGNRKLRFWNLANGESWSGYERQTEGITSVALSNDARWILIGGADGSLRLREWEWDFRFDGLADWDENARAFLESFLTRHCALDDNRLAHVGGPILTEQDYEELKKELESCGFGWLSMNSVRREVATMVKDWKGPRPLLVNESKPQVRQAGQQAHQPNRGSTSRP